MSVRVRDLTVSLSGRVVTEAVTTGIDRGGWLGIIGPNGAGKSTILRAIVGTIPYAGVVEIEGRGDIHHDRRESARMIAYVPQRPELPPMMRVCDYVMLGRTPHLSLFATEGPRDLQVVEEVLCRLELAHLRDRTLSEISGGEAQRAVLGRALVQEASVLVLDEPTTGLDLGHQEQVLELTDELRHERGLTVICAMHDLTVAGQFCDRLTLIDRGRVVVEGAVAEVLTPDRIRKHFGAAVEVVDDGVGGIIVVPRRRPRQR